MEPGEIAAIGFGMVVAISAALAVSGWLLRRGEKE